MDGSQGIRPFGSCFAHLSGPGTRALMEIREQTPVNNVVVQRWPSLTRIDPRLHRLVYRWPDEYAKCRPLDLQMSHPDEHSFRYQYRYTLVITFQ